MSCPSRCASGLRNFFSNLGEPIVFLNDLLQLKPGRAFKTFARFIINSTIGIGGLIDVAKSPQSRAAAPRQWLRQHAGLLRRRPGPLSVPAVHRADHVPGSDRRPGRRFRCCRSRSAIRSIAREYQIPRGRQRHRRCAPNRMPISRRCSDSAVDPYATLRSVYLQNRAAEITGPLHSRSRRPAVRRHHPLDDPLTRPGAPAQASPLDDPLNDPRRTAASRHPPHRSRRSSATDASAPAKP